MNEVICAAADDDEAVLTLVVAFVPRALVEVPATWELVVTVALVVGAAVVAGFAATDGIDLVAVAATALDEAP